MDEKLYVTDSLYYRKNKLYDEFLDNETETSLKTTLINN